MLIYTCTMLSSTFAKLLHVIQQFCYYYLNLIDEEAES